MPHRSSSLDRLTRFTHELIVSLLNLDLHAPDSQLVRDNLDNLTAELAGIFAQGDREPLTLDVERNMLCHEGEHLVSSSLQARRLLTLCHQRSIRRLQFAPATTADELLHFLLLLSCESTPDDFHPENVEKLLRARAIENIRVELDREGPAASDPDAPARQAMIQYQALTECLQENHIAAFRGHVLEIEKACGLVEAALSQMDSPSGLLALASHDYIDSFTVGHSVRVALLALQVATAGGADRRQLIRVGTAALLHDIGKSRIPQEILFKRGALTAAEREVMSTHPRLGGELLLEQGDLDPSAIGAAFCHHMTPAGGYPTAAIPFRPSGISKLVRVCDVFEALTSVRPYKRALTPLEAYSVMFGDRLGFDREWLRFFARSLGIYPPGTMLGLDTGERALVTGQGKSPTQPEIEVLTDNDGRSLAPRERRTVILGETVDGIVRRVRSPIPDAAHRHDHTAATAPAEDGIRSCCGEDLTTKGEDTQT